MSPNGAAEPVMIDGFRLERIERPDTAQQLAETLAQAAHEHLAVAPLGGGTKVGYGNVPRRLDLAVSTRSLNRVLSYQPTDLTLSVEAGATLAQVQTVLGEHGQWLPIDAARPEQATIGGLIASALSGPRRLGSETFRDLLIGISVAHPDGVVSKAGGLVVKNVSGFDMMRLYLGSLGTLGVIVSANFKTLPRPRMERTLLVELPDLAAGFDLAQRLLQSRARPVALELEQQSADGWQLAARIEGRPGAVGIMSAEASQLVNGDVVRLTDDLESADWWQRYVNRQAHGGDSESPTLRVHCRPRDTSRLLDQLAADGLLTADDRLSLSPGLGEVRITRSVGTQDAATVHAQRAGLMHRADHVTLITGNPDLKRGVDVWGKEPVTLDVMKALKTQFDPADLLNPGRFAGFI